MQILIGPGDLIEVSVYGAPDYLKEVRVRSTGEITLPLAGTVKVGGLTPAQAEVLIAKHLGDRVFSIVPFSPGRGLPLEETLSSAKCKNQESPPGRGTCSRALGRRRRSPGCNPVSISHREDPQHSEVVTLSENSKSSSQSNVHVYPAYGCGIESGNRLCSWRCWFAGGFVMENSHMTMLQAFAMAQGANPTAALDRAQLIRKSGPENQPQEAPISLKKILAQKAPDMNLQPGDIVFVPTSAAKAAGRRTLEAIVQTATGMAIYSRGGIP